jgi:flagellar protein FlaJ
MKSVPDACIDYFTTYFESRRGNYERLREDLLKARMYVSVEAWLAKGFFVSLLASFSFALLVLLKLVFLGCSVLDVPLVLGVILVFLSSFFAFCSYPRIKAWERKRRIEALLPYAIGFMASMASVGVVPYHIFKKLSESEEIYGAVSVEANQVARDVELLGFDLLTALRKLAHTTSSPKMRAFVQGAVMTALSGGEMGSYFVKKARQYSDENRKKFEDFITTLGIISEVYIVGLITAPLFAIIIFITMLMLRGAGPEMLFVIIYGVIPLGSLAFMLIVDALTPEGIK